MATVLPAGSKRSLSGFENLFFFTVRKYRLFAVQTNLTISKVEF